MVSQYKGRCHTSLGKKYIKNPDMTHTLWSPCEVIQCRLTGLQIHYEHKPENAQLWLGWKPITTFIANLSSFMMNALRCNSLPNAAYAFNSNYCKPKTVYVKRRSIVVSFVRFSQTRNYYYCRLLCTLAWLGCTVDRDSYYIHLYHTAHDKLDNFDH